MRWFRLILLEFCLPLPLLAVGFWWASSSLTDWVLTRHYATENRLQTNTLFDPSVEVVFIEAKIDRQQGKTQVEVRKFEADPVQFELDVTRFAELEATIAQKLNLSPEAVRSLVRYEFVD